MFNIYQNIIYSIEVACKISTVIVSILAKLRFIHGNRVPDRKPRLSLSSLPIEILQHISNFLPLSSAVSLTLSSRKLLKVLGSQSLHSLRADEQKKERRRFLVALQRDLPDWLLCHYCSVFHPITSDEGPKSVWRYRQEPACVQAPGVIYLTVDFRIRYHNAQLLMNHYRFGRAYMKNLESLSYNYSLILDDTVLKGALCSSIVAGELLVRVNSKLRLLGPWNIKLIQRRMYPVCPHLKYYCQDQTLWQTIDCRLSHPNKLPCAECSMWKSCRVCSTRFHVDVQELENLQTEVQLDVWRNLGTCETPYDPKWRKQAEPQCRNIIKPLPPSRVHWPTDNTITICRTS